LAKSIEIPAGVIGLYEALAEVHGKYREELRPVKLTRRDKDTSLAQKAPLLNFVAFQLEVEKVRQAFGEVCEVLAQHRPKLKRALIKLQKTVAGDERLLKSLVEKFVWQDNNYMAGFVAKNKVNGELLALTLFNTSKPFVANYARVLEGQFRDDLWRENFCPVCGWKPVMAANTGESRRRVLHCALCDTEWSFKNLECPHCLNEDHETLGYLTVEDDEVYRVNICEKCKGYIKSVNEENLFTRENFFLTDIKTLHLDLLAQREGYCREVSNWITKDKN